MYDNLYQILQGILTSNDIVFYYRSLDSVLDKVTRLWAGCPMIFGLTLALGRRFISFPIVHTSSGTHSASFSMGAGDCFLRGEGFGV